MSVSTTVAFWLKSEQKEKEKQILKLNTTQFKLINPEHWDAYSITLYKINENFSFSSNN